RVEPSCELARMMVEVAGHLVPAPAVEGVLLPLGPVAEAVLELFGGAIRGVCDAPGDAEPGPWAVVGLVVVAPTEVGIEPDGGYLGVVPGDLVRSGPGRGGDHRQALHLVGVGDAPFEGAHPSHRAADHQRPAVDAQLFPQSALRGHLVPRGQHGEAGTVGAAVRCLGAGTGAP